jgi:hypothetical protein
MKIPKSTREQAAVPSEWRWAEKNHPGVYASWLRGPNLDAKWIGTTGRQNRFVVVTTMADSQYVRDRAGDGEWVLRTVDNDPLALPHRIERQRNGYQWRGKWRPA